jgi:hypothetical protein
MAKMRITTITMNLGAAHEKAFINRFADICLVNRRKKAWPARSRVKFGLG